MAKLTEYADLRLDATQLATFSITHRDGRHIGNVTQAVDSCTAEIELREDVDVDGLFHGVQTIVGRIEAPGLKTLLERVKTFLDSQGSDWQGGREQVLQLSATRSVEWWQGFYEGPARSAIQADSREEASRRQPRCLPVASTREADSEAGSERGIRSERTSHADHHAFLRRRAVVHGRHGLVTGSPTLP